MALMLEAFGLSDRGCVRSNNEDYFIKRTDLGVFIVADGMGGANAGEHASRLSAETLCSYLENHHNGTRTLEAAFRTANERVLEEARSNPDLQGMGTTLIAAVHIGEGEFEIASVGDSRAYVFSKHQGLSLVTRDQTWVAEVGSRLGLTDDALKTHPMRHVLTMAVGTVEDLEVQFRRIKVESADQILLCSDGLHGVLDEKTLEQILESESSLPDKCHYLVDAARVRGGPDNVTVLLIQFA